MSRRASGICDGLLSSREKRKKGAGWPMGVLDRAMVKNKSRRKITW